MWKNAAILSQNEWCYLMYSILVQWKPAPCTFQVCYHLVTSHNTFTAIISRFILQDSKLLPSPRTSNYWALFQDFYKCSFRPNSHTKKFLFNIWWTTNTIRQILYNTFCTFLSFKHYVWWVTVSQGKKCSHNFHEDINPTKKKKTFTSTTNKIQCYTIYLFLWNAPHVSGSSSTHHQELKTVYIASGTMSNPFCYLPLSVLTLPRQWQVAVKVWQSTRCCITVLSSWLWAEEPPETRRAFHK